MHFAVSSRIVPFLVAVIPGIAAVQILSKLETGQACSNTFHIEHPGGGVPDLSELTNLANDLDTWLSTTWLAQLRAGSVLYSYKVEQVRPPGDLTPLLAYTKVKNSAGTGGALSGQLAPEAACEVIKIISPYASKSARGHLFMPSCRFASEMNGRLWLVGGTYHTANAAIAVKLAAGASNSPTWTGTSLPNYSLGVFSRIAGGGAPTQFFVANAVVADQIVHWLRSRERGTS